MPCWTADDINFGPISSTYFNDDDDNDDYDDDDDDDYNDEYNDDNNTFGLDVTIGPLNP